jgi:hypothetical protein
MLENMSPNRERHEFHDIRRGREGINGVMKDDGQFIAVTNKIDDNFARSSSASGRESDALNLIESDPIAVSPRQINGKHETVF